MLAGYAGEPDIYLLVVPAWPVPSLSGQAVFKVATMETIELDIENPESSELLRVMRGLLADLANASAEIQGHALKLLEGVPELCRLESGAASGAKITFLLKPSDFLLDLCLAVRTGNFDKLVVGNEHGSSLAVNGVVRDSILPAMGEPPQVFRFDE